MDKEMPPSVYFDRKTLAFIGLSSYVKDKLKSAYKGVDVEKELAKMCAWLVTHPHRQYGGNLSFITNWLDKSPVAYEAATNAAILDFSEASSPIAAELKAYREDLWKDRASILDFNTMSYPTS